MIKEEKEIINKLLKELDIIRKEEDFKVYGFGAGFKYNEWYKDLDQFISSPTISMEALLISRHLKVLAVSYALVQGNDLTYINHVRNLIDEGLDPELKKKIEKNKKPEKKKTTKKKAPKKKPIKKKK